MQITEYLNKYVYFFDKQGVKRAGYVYRINNRELEVNSKQVNQRGVSKLYYYTLKKEDILAVIPKEEAINFASKINEQQS